ncbi:hypothetical protein NM208_g1199 [Fusarium decemcellulare]|uniref:Uncharacterized protein n=1 Tax=Fusarium decemcellulare TaxID=57161 RepID=A0ACC1SX06_9HYPO|nr:hypothetical protein NM208_g1199 [Fusarium decemcellulare]
MKLRRPLRPIQDSSTLYKTNLFHRPKLRVCRQTPRDTGITFSVQTSSHDEPISFEIDISPDQDVQDDGGGDDRNSARVKPTSSCCFLDFSPRFWRPTSPKATTIRATAIAVATFARQPDQFASPKPRAQNTR